MIKIITRCGIIRRTSLHRGVAYTVARAGCFVTSRRTM